MQIVNIHQAKTHLSRLLQDVAEGKEVVIAKAGKPVATVTAFKQEKKPRKAGLWKGKVWVSDDFDDEDKELNKLFYEGDI